MTDNALRSVVGLLPAAGRAQRMSPSPCSKEIYPIGLRQDASGKLVPLVASRHLFDKFRSAGAETAYLVLRRGKWDVPAYFTDDAVGGLTIAYIVINESIGPPDTLDRAFPFVLDRTVLFAFPDILFGPDDVFERLLERLGETESNLALALYDVHDSAAMDTVDVDTNGKVTRMALKGGDTSFTHSWVCAAWTPAFTRFLHRFMDEQRRSAASDARDLSVGAAIKTGIERGLRACGVVFEREQYLDIGTPDGLREAIARSGDAGRR